MKLYLINPSNPLTAFSKVKESYWTPYQVGKPLGLMVLAGSTPPEWEISIVDENLGVPDYSAMPRPNLVGITAFTSQANRAYEIAAYFRGLGVPVVMGGIHASMNVEEAIDRVDSIVTGEAEDIWHQVLEDARQGSLKGRYDGGFAKIDSAPLARHDLLQTGYAFGAIQTTRGCALSCAFCSVTAFNGARYRLRPIPDILREFQLIREKRVLVVDDNLIGTRPEHIARAKDLFRAMIRKNLGKEWIAQVTINFADDEELLSLAEKAGCQGVLIGFESLSSEGLQEIGKTFNILKGRDFRASVRRIQRHRILVAGSFIIGLDIDKSGIGKRIAEAAGWYGVDHLNALFLTPFPGTRLWDQLKSEDRITFSRFPEDWKYYTFKFPVVPHRLMSFADLVQEMYDCEQEFYSIPCILRRVWRDIWEHRNPFFSFVISLSYRRSLQLNHQACNDLKYQLRNSLNSVRDAWKDS